jgi:outer membrane protein OmpA-like peptidoglycan-associated protein
VEVEVHSEDQGGSALSQARAEAVVGSLIRSGVAPSRLAARGLGPPSPAPSTSAARARNRRVEFHLHRRPPG